MARRPGTKGMLVFIIGNIVFSIFGLIIGYFLLVQIRPDMNFLNMNIPRVADMQGPQVPEWWPSYDWDPSKPYTSGPSVNLGAVQPAPAETAPST